MQNSYTCNPIYFLLCKHSTYLPRLKRTATSVCRASIVPQKPEMDRSFWDNNSKSTVDT